MIDIEALLVLGCKSKVRIGIGLKDRQWHDGHKETHRAPGSDGVRATSEG